MKKIFLKAMILGAVTFPMMTQSAHALKLSEVLKSSKAIATYWSFKKDEALHCGRKAAIFSVGKTMYELSSLRVVGLENSKKYKNFKDFVIKEKLLETESKITTPYKEFPEMQTEVFHISLTDPKVTVRLALRPIIAPPVTSKSKSAVIDSKK